MNFGHLLRIYVRFRKKTKYAIIRQINNAKNTMISGFFYLQKYWLKKAASQITQLESGTSIMTTNDLFLATKGNPFMLLNIFRVQI